MSSLNPLLTKIFRGPLDLNGPVIGRMFFLFEYARSHVEERREEFDSRFGTDTSSPTFEKNQKTDVHFYVPTTASIIYQSLRSLNLDPDRFVFVDLGSGKGRAVLIASEFPYKKIVGVELSEHLHKVAGKNIELYRPDNQACKAFDLRCMNALDYSFEEEPLVLFLFDPFGREVLQQVVDKLQLSLASAPRPAHIVYVYPQYEDVLQNAELFEKTGGGGPKWQPWSQYVVYSTRRDARSH
jgi:SAM-dependent methyltransferase